MMITTEEQVVKDLIEETVNAWIRVSSAEQRGDSEQRKIELHTWGILFSICRRSNIAIDWHEVTSEHGA